MAMLPILFLCCINSVLTNAGYETEATVDNCIEIQYPLRDCSDLNSNENSGVYMIQPEGSGQFPVYCDMLTDGGGWTVFQRRKNGLVDFYRGWDHYKNGFGTLEGEFWLGNDKLHNITAQGQYFLHIDMEDFNSVKKFALYKTFSVSGENKGYELSVRDYSGTAGDSLTHHNRHPFVTKDRDDGPGCSALYKGGWWYYSCHVANLNGLYFEKNSKYGQGIQWRSITGLYTSLKHVTMKMKRISYKQTSSVGTSK